MPRGRPAGRIGRLAVAVWAVAGVVVLALLLVAGRYGFHGDEFYFVVTGRHLQIAAPDNPMLVPYLAAGWYGLVGGHLWAFRVLPALASGAYVLLGGLIAREFGAAPRHQVAAAVAVAMTALTLGDPRAAVAARAGGRVDHFFGGQHGDADATGRSS